MYLSALNMRPDWFFLALIFLWQIIYCSLQTKTKRKAVLWKGNHTYDAVAKIRYVSKFRVASRGSPCDSTAFLSDASSLSSERWPLRCTESVACVVTRTHSTFGDRACAADGPAGNSLLSRLRYCGLWSYHSRFQRSEWHFCLNSGAMAHVWTILTGPSINTRTYLLTYLLACLLLPRIYLSSWTIGLLCCDNWHRLSLEYAGYRHWTSTFHLTFHLLSFASIFLSFPLPLFSSSPSLSLPYPATSRRA